MNLLNPAEITQSYALAGKAKGERPFGSLLALSVLAGMLIAFGAAAANTAAHALGNVSLVRLVNGLLFPFGLAIVMLLGAELFTGNTLMSISLLNRDTTLGRMLRNWAVVYAGNFAGALLVAAGCVWFGQLGYSQGGLALYTIQIAAAKCAMPFGNTLVLGVFCNILVCAGVLCSLSAKDTTGRILGAYLPVAFFVISGFEHCVANMYYVPAGLFAMQVPQYAALAAQAGVDTAALGWGSFWLHSLLPATLGNIIGGTLLGAAMWACNLRRAKRPLQVQAKEKTGESSEHTPHAS